MLWVAGFGIAVLIAVLTPIEPALGQAQAGTAAQQPEAAAPQSFEVASIKPSAAEMQTVKMQISPGGRYMASGVTLKMLIQQAYDIRDFQISGAPGWMASDRYDIVAKAEPPGLDRERIKILLKSLIAERFKLAFHNETKELTVYALVVGKNGHRLHKSDVQPEPGSDAPQAKTPQPGDTRAPGRAPEGGPDVIRKGGAKIRMGRGEISAEVAPMSMLTSMLAQQLGRTVLDKTGLSGNFDFRLEWTPDDGQRGPGPDGDGPAEGAPVSDSSGPSIFTAVQEQLGLKLESQKGPVDILVIDHVEKPTEN